MYIRLLFSLALVGFVACRGSFSIGNPGSSRLVYHEIHEKYAMPLMKRSEDLFVKGNDNELIRAVVVDDLKGNGRSFIEGGGLYQRNVTIRLESGVRGNGYKFLVNVYAS